MKLGANCIQQVENYLLKISLFNRCPRKTLTFSDLTHLYLRLKQLVTTKIPSLLPMASVKFKRIRYNSFLKESFHFQVAIPSSCTRKRNLTKRISLTECALLEMSGHSQQTLFQCGRTKT